MKNFCLGVTAVLMIADTHLTAACLGAGYVELNPYMVEIANTLAVFMMIKVLAFALIWFLADLADDAYPNAGQYPAATAAIACLVPVMNNILLLI